MEAARSGPLRCVDAEAIRREMRRSEGKTFRIVSDARQTARSNASTSRDCSPCPGLPRPSSSRVYPLPTGCLF
jgi:hypothetical protein